MLKKLSTFLFLVLLLVFCFSCNKKVRDEQTLIVGTNAEFAPFTFLKDGELVGFDIDIANEVAKRLGKSITFKDMPFEALIPALALGNVDFLAAGMSCTDERSQRVAFTKPYHSNDPLVIVTIPQSIDINSLDDLCDRSVVVNEGYTADVYMTDKKCLSLLRLHTPADAFLALKSQRADAYVTAQSTVNFFLNEQKGTELRVIAIPNSEDTCALVIAKNNPQLFFEIQKTLNDMEVDGTIVNTKSKWKL